MPRKPSAGDIPHATISVSHRALSHERAELLRRHRGRKGQPECVLIGHAWIEDPGRPGGRICLVCTTVKHP